MRLPFLYRLLQLPRMFFSSTCFWCCAVQRIGSTLDEGFLREEYINVVVHCWVVVGARLMTTKRINWFFDTDQKLPPELLWCNYYFVAISWKHYWVQPPWNLIISRSMVNMLDPPQFNSQSLSFLPMMVFIFLCSQISTRRSLVCDFSAIKNSIKPLNLPHFAVVSFSQSLGN